MAAKNLVSHTSGMTSFLLDSIPNNGLIVEGGLILAPGLKLEAWDEVPTIVGQQLESTKTWILIFSFISPFI